MTSTTTATSTTTTTTTTTATSSAGVTPDEVFLTLNLAEQTALLAICATIIPTDSTGPGATEAGCAYFIDHQLKEIYGYNGNVYAAGPWIPANTTGPITVDGATYSGATIAYAAGSTTYTVNYPTTPNVRVGAGTRYQYALTMRDFWRLGLAGIEAYSNAGYGGNFESLSAANQAQVLQDLWNNKPTAAQFGDILPSDFAYELFFMTWCGFGMDPVYGGNRNMVGWTYTGFSGVNQGNFYGEGYTTSQIMVMNTPITLKPASLAQFQSQL